MIWTDFGSGWSPSPLFSTKGNFLFDGEYFPFSADCAVHLVHLYDLTFVAFATRHLAYRYV